MNSSRVGVVLLLVLAVGMGLATSQLARRTVAPPTVKMEEPPYRGLDSNLFMQTSAEYRACCLQAFQWAKVRVEEKLKGKPDPGQCAVILDLDETVFDNAVFQSRQIRSGRAYDQKVWDAWEESDGEYVRLVPGAKEFLVWLRDKRVNAVYITNRNDKFRAQTHAVLKRLDLDVPDAQLLLASTTSDKTERRKTAREAFDVILLVGDNLRDFDDEFRYDKSKGIAGRASVVDTRRDKFGTDWIILPNPAYGEWMKPLGQGVSDTNLMRFNR